jgi:hypothetical protein
MYLSTTVKVNMMRDFGLFFFRYLDHTFFVSLRAAFLFLK